MNKKLTELEKLKQIAKLGSSPIKSPDYTSPLEQDVMKVRGLPEAPEQVTRLKEMTDKIDTKQIAPILSGEEFTDKISKLRALKAAGKKVAGIIPLAGVGMAMMDSPAASASELVKDPNVQRAALSELAGPVGDVIDIGGDIAEIGLNKYRELQDEKGMQESERQALENYKKSPARLARLKALIGGKNE